MNPRAQVFPTVLMKPQPSHHPVLFTTTSFLPATSKSPVRRTWGRERCESKDSFSLSGLQYQREVGQWEAEKGETSLVPSSSLRLGIISSSYSNLLRMPSTYQKNRQNDFIFLNTIPGPNNVKRNSLRVGYYPATIVTFCVWNYHFPNTTSDRNCQLPHPSISVSSSCLQRGLQHSPSAHF